MSDLIRREDAIDAIEDADMQVYSCGAAIGMRTYLTKEEIVTIIYSLPSAEPEMKNRKTALSVQVEADFDDMKDLLEDIGNLQTYKLFEGDGMVFANIEDIKGILTKHIKAKEVQPEMKKGEWIEYPDCLRYEGAYNDDHIVCSECGHVFSICDNCTEEFDFCPHCGADMRGE